MDKPSQPTRIAVTEESRNPMWKSKTKGMIPIKDMDDDYLQKALLYSQVREWDFYKKMCKFTDLIKALDEEAERRGLKLKDISDVEAPGVPKSKRLAQHWRHRRRAKVMIDKLKEQKV